MNRKEREAEYREEERRIWGEFERQLAALNTAEEARALARATPRPGEPGRRFYSNLAALFTMRMLPSPLSFDEKVTYYSLLQRPAIRVYFEPDEYERIVHALRTDLTGRGIID